MTRAVSLRSQDPPSQGMETENLQEEITRGVTPPAEVHGGGWVGDETEGRAARALEGLTLRAGEARAVLWGVAYPARGYLGVMWRAGGGGRRRREVMAPEVEAKPWAPWGLVFEKGLGLCKGQSDQ